MANVKVYSTPTCPYCYMAKNFLRQNNIEFEDINVAADYSGAIDMVRKSGQQGVPVIDIEGDIIIGYDQERMREALKLA
jgi:glutaredoxin 3